MDGKTFEEELLERIGYSDLKATFARIEREAREECKDGNIWPYIAGAYKVVAFSLYELIQHSIAESKRVMAEDELDYN